MIIKLESTDKALSANAGLLILKNLIEAQRLSFGLADSIPSLKYGSAKNIRKFKQMVLALGAGAECLDDIDRLAFDPAFQALCDDKVYSAKACGDFLRSFDSMNCKNLDKKLIASAYQLRKQLFGKTNSITIDIDSTSNPQHGKKMEGVETNYKGLSCLDTIHAFDEYGIQYWSEVRPGRTHTATGALEIIHQVFHNMPRNKTYKKMQRYVRADSGYCKSDFFNACTAKGAHFVVCMRSLMYKPLIKKVSHWEPQNPNKEGRIKFKGNRECEVGETVYKPKNSQHLVRVVMIRAAKVGREEQLIKGDEDYDYYGWVTSIGKHGMTAENVVKFYRRRGHAENFIRENKNGFDMHHYPCQKLLANRAFGLIAAFAYNLMRFIALRDDPKRPQFAKAIRFRLIHLPCQVVRHAREVVFRFMEHHHKEMQNWLNNIKTLQLGFT